MVKRRQVVDIAKCNGCHSSLSLHGENRNQTEYCVLCHNPQQYGTAQRRAQAINFAQMIHKIHSGEGLTAAGLSLSRSGRPSLTTCASRHVAEPEGGDTAKCYMCHVNRSEAVFPIGLTPVKDPQGLLTPARRPPQPAPPATWKSVLAHVVSQTDAKQGESCDICHGAAASFSVLKVHAGK